MKENARKMMVVSGVAGNVARITMTQLDERTRQGASDAELVEIYRSSSDAETVVVPMTEAAFAAACRHLGARPCYATLAAYPYPSP